MNKKQIKAEKDRLRPIVFEGAPDWAIESTYSRIYGFWVWQGNINEYNERQMKKCKNQPQTTLDWRDTLIKRGDL